MASANHVGAAVLVHVAFSDRLDDVIDERSFGVQYAIKRINNFVLVFFRFEASP